MSSKHVLEAFALVTAYQEEGLASFRRTLQSSELDHEAITLGLLVVNDMLFRIATNVDLRGVTVEEVRSIIWAALIDRQFRDADAGHQPNGMNPTFGDPTLPSPKSLSPVRQTVPGVRAASHPPPMVIARLERPPRPRGHCFPDGVHRWSSSPIGIVRDPYWPNHDRPGTTARGEGADSYKL